MECEKNRNIRMIGLDLDGTVFNDEKKITAHTKEAVSYTHLDASVRRADYAAGQEVRGNGSECLGVLMLLSLSLIHIFWSLYTLSPLKQKHNQLFC